MKKVLYIRASQPQHTPAGKLLGKLYYRGFLDLLDQSEYSGYPHNGGEHSLSLSMTEENLSALLSLIRATYATHEGCEPFINSILSEIATRYPDVNLKA